TTLITAGKIVISSTTNLDDWRKTGDLTMIDGGSISTGTVTATQISANTITASEIFGNTITANEMAANTITASEIFGGTITGTEITGTTLSGIFADLGSITAGNITLDSSGYIKGGQTAYNTGIGFWLGYSSAWKFSIGNPAGHYLTWDGSDLVGKFKLKSLETFITGQTLTAGDYVFVSDDAITEVAVEKWANGGTKDGTYNVGRQNFAYKYVGQAFVIAGSGTINITKVTLYMGGVASPGNFKVSIQGDSGGYPDGSALRDTGWLAEGAVTP
ncbi:unnamed protein product, partial [marine sediment metagenome]